MQRSTRARVAAGWAAFAVLGSLLAVSCDCPLDPPPPPVLRPCQVGRMVTISVGPGMDPTFSWTPECLIGRLIVESNPGEEYWGTERAGLNTYRSPIRYGVHPPGSEDQQVAQPLDTLTVFTVSLYRWTSTLPESLDAGGHLVGRATFSPRPLPGDSVATLHWAINPNTRPWRDARAVGGPCD